MINTINAPNEKMQVIWDLGRRCTYACSYCAGYRSNNWSPIASWEELLKTLHFIESYCDLYDFYRNDNIKLKNTITFTGGEPTVNPRLFDLIDYGYENLDEKFNFGLTTNAAFSNARALKIKNHGMFGTVSYHAEAERKTKDLVIENIFTLKDTFKVNVMFHNQYFQECIDLCELLKKEGIRFIPRIIGDGGDVKKGLLLGTHQEYTEEQMKWFRDFWGSTNKKKDKTNMGLGRACCGGRRFCTRDNENEWKDNVTFLPDTNFYNWNCMINWYFLYVHSELDLVYTHQTCSVNFNNKVGPLGKLSESDKILDDLESKFLNDKMPTIRCPKTFCGCGMCVTKTSDNEHMKELWEFATKGVSSNLSSMHDRPQTQEEFYDIPAGMNELDGKPTRAGIKLVDVLK